MPPSLSDTSEQTTAFRTMEIEKTLYVTDRKAWRQWLAKHHEKETEVWLLYFRKATGKPRIPYNDAVEEALCYGWIDSIVKTLDQERLAQRFSVRQRTSVLSQLNKERVRMLIAQQQMTPAGLAAIAHVFAPDKDSAENFTIPPDILQPLQANKQAWKNFQQFPAGLPKNQNCLHCKPQTTWPRTISKGVTTLY